MRLVVFDDALLENDQGWTADEVAAALRAPLAAIGVRVVRRHRSAGNSNGSGFQAHGLSARAYKAKSEKVRSVLESVLKSARGKADVMVQGTRRNVWSDSSANAGDA